MNVNIDGETVAVLDKVRRAHDLSSIEEALRFSVEFTSEVTDRLDRLRHGAQMEVRHSKASGG